MSDADTLATATEASRATRLRLQVFAPTQTLVDEPVRKIIAEAANGSFCLLPRHIDCVAELVPGILSFLDTNAVERFVAVDVGTLVKADDRVRIATLNAVVDDDLERLSDTVTESFLTLEQHEQEARSALGRLEAGTLRGFAETRFAETRFANTQETR
ncbi:F0F1 ATP synthase subunit epsilon [Halochromatium salexigens]|uniref:F0F1 ATP synthase subunit epsilon n=1 Tax=Halochromatium salexigens TaxID=49447 RepID=UPI00191224F4|nr:F0F1 ATP synthase subunit epsilon [Halochromatium salexigens]